MPANDHLAEDWRAGLAAWITANLPAALTAASFGVREAHEEGERPLNCIVVGYDRVQRVPSMEATGRVFGLVLLRSPHDDYTVAQHRAHVAELWGLLQTLAIKPGPLTDVYLHDVRWEDRETLTEGGDRITIWQLSTMATAGRSA